MEKTLLCLKIKKNFQDMIPVKVQALQATAAAEFEWKPQFTQLRRVQPAQKRFVVRRQLAT